MDRLTNKNLLFEKIELLKTPLAKRTKEQNERIAEIQYLLNEEARGGLKNFNDSQELDQQTQDMIDNFNGREV